MRITRTQLRALILEAVKPKEVKESEMRKAVINCLKKEGGAAGMKLIVKSVKSLQTRKKKLPRKFRTNRSIERFVLKMKETLKHRNGDIILTIGLPKR